MTTSIPDIHGGKETKLYKSIQSFPDIDCDTNDRIYWLSSIHQLME